MITALGTQAVDVFIPGLQRGIEIPRTALGSFLPPPLACLNLPVQGEKRLADSPGVCVPAYLPLHRSLLQSNFSNRDRHSTH